MAHHFRTRQENRALLAETELPAKHRAATLPDIELDALLATCVHRCASEVDIGTPRWSEAPSPLFAALANHLRITDPEQAPDRRFERAARAGAAGPGESRLRGRLTGFFLQWARQLAGLRELAKFAGCTRSPRWAGGSCGSARTWSPAGCSTRPTP